MEMKHVGASKCCRNHFISEKYKTVQSFKLYCLQNISLFNCTILPTTVNLLETFLEAILCKPFQLFRPIFMISVASLKLRPFNPHFIQGNT
jgi:hypothetical protein